MCVSYQGIETPPLGRMVWPVTNDDRSDSRNRTGPAISSGRPNRRTACMSSDGPYRHQLVVGITGSSVLFYARGLPGSAPGGATFSPAQAHR